MEQFEPGVDESQDATKNTGVEEPQVAAVEGLEGDDVDPNTQGEQAPEESKDITIGELLGEEPEKVDEQGDDNPPAIQENGNSQPQNQTPPAPKQQSSADFSKALNLRVQQERAKIEAEYVKKNAASRDDRITGRAHQLMAEFPDDIKTIEYAKRQAAREIDAETSSAPTAPQAESAPANDAESQKQAWIGRLETEGSALQAATGDPSITWQSYAEKDPIFKNILGMGYGPVKAHEITQSMRAELGPELKAAAAKGGREVVQQIKSSNSKATAPVKPSNAGGKKTRGMADWTADEIDEAIDEAARQGKTLKIG